MKKKNTVIKENDVEEKVLRLCGDVIFKAVFLREKEVLLKMIYDITDISETMHFEEVITGYELEPYILNGKVNKSDMLLKLGNNYFLNIELNYQHESNVMYRNMIQLFRICGQITESGMTDKQLSLKKVGQLNFNTFSNSNNKEFQRGMYTDEDGQTINNFLTFWNVDIVKCYNKVYNNIEQVQKLSKVLRWGAILYTDLNNPNIDGIAIIEKMIGDDLLTMEEKEKLIKRIKDTKNNKKIIQEWMVEENNRIREENVLRTAREDGRLEGIQEGKKEGKENKTLEVIKNMLIKKLDISIISEVTGKTVEEIKEIETNMLSEE